MLKVIKKLQEELTAQKIVAKALSDGLDQTEKLLEKEKEKNKKLIQAKNEYYQNNLSYESQISGLVKVLEEIREIINTCSVINLCKKCKFNQECDRNLEGFILNKIDEVLNG